MGESQAGPRVGYWAVHLGALTEPTLVALMVVLKVVRMVGSKGLHLAVQKAVLKAENSVAYLAS